MTSKQDLVIVLGGIRKSSSNPDVREFKVKISGSLSNNVKEETLSNLRDNICICWRGENVSRVLREEDL